MATKSLHSTTLAFLLCLGATAARADTWDGLFVGIDAGTVAAEAKYTTGPDNSNWFAAQGQTAGMWQNGANTQSKQAPVGGVFVAYNRQAGAWVYGGEVGLSLMDVDLQHSGTYRYQGIAKDYDYRQKTNARGLFTLKGRSGYAFGNGLLSVSAGAALTDLRTGLGYDDNYVPPMNYLASHDDRRYKLGWTAGAAYEYRLPQDLIIKAEYQYLDFGSSSFTTPVYTSNGTYITQMNFSSRLRMSTYTVGIEKKF
jgi:opacity protein-like surface antigen